MKMQTTLVAFWKKIKGYFFQVNLRDINDNAPMFPDEMFGYLDENRPVDC